MNLNLKGFSQLVEDMGAALQSSASNLIDVSVGSVVRAIFEANASVVLWLQWLIVQVLAATRASTSTGADLDSWMLDFGLTRLPAIASSGVVTFSRFVNTLPAAVPIGTTIKTADGSLSFSVTADDTLSIWQTAVSAYVLPSGVSSASLPVVCSTSGLIGNVLAGTISVIAASLPGIDQITNSSPLSDGADAESDQALRIRFQSYLSSRSLATLAAVENAIATVQQGLNVSIHENTGANGIALPGTFLVVADDGTGYPPSNLISTIATAVDSVRPVGTAFSIIPPIVLTVNVSLSVVVTSATASSVVTIIQNSVAAYLNSLPIEVGASVTRVAQSAYQAGAGILNVTAILLNDAALDIPVPFGTVVKAGQVTVAANVG